jgi:hypothetical protein
VLLLLTVRSNSEQSRSFVVQELDLAPAVYRSLCIDARVFWPRTGMCPCQFTCSIPFGQPNNARRFFVSAVRQFANGHVSVCVSKVEALMAEFSLLEATSSEP